MATSLSGRQSSRLEIHFVAAWVAHMNGYVQEAPAHISRAEGWYGGILAQLPKRAWLVPVAKQALREEARAGLRRVERAKAGDYDDKWLLI